MDKEKMAYDLALIYTKTLFGLYAARLNEKERNDPAALTNELYLLFEEAYVLFLLRDGRNYDFSDVIRG